MCVEEVEEGSGLGEGLMEESPDQDLSASTMSCQPTRTHSVSVTGPNGETLNSKLCLKSFYIYSGTPLKGF